MQKKKLISIAAVLAIAGAVASLYFTQTDRSKIDFSNYGSAGTVAAEETARLIGGKGTVALYTVDSEETIPALHAQIESFKKTLTAKNIQIIAIEKIKTGTMSAQLEPSQIARTLKSHDGLKAIVSFVRLSSLSDEDSAALKQRTTKLVVISSYTPFYKKLFNAQLLHLAVVPRLGAAIENAPEPKTVRDQFDQTYQLLTPENLAALP